MTTTTLNTLQVLKMLLRDQPMQLIAEGLKVDLADVRQVGHTYGYPDHDKLRWAVDELQTALDTQARAGIPPALDTVTARTAPRLDRVEHVPAVASKPAVVAELRPQKPPHTVTVPAAVSTYVGDPPPAEAKPDRVAELLFRASQSTYKRTKDLGTKVADMLDNLSQRLDDEDAERRRIQAAETQRKQVLDELAAAEKALAEAREKAKALKVKPTGSATASTSRTPAGDHDPKVVRAWAAENGVACPSMGRVPRTVVDAWRKAGGS